MDRPTVRPNFNVIAAQLRSVAARPLARENSFFVPAPDTARVVRAIQAWRVP